MKKALAFAVIALLAVTAPAAARAGEHGPAAPSIEGNWLSVVHYDGQPLIQFLHVFTADGRTFLMLPFGPDNLIPGGPPAPSANVGDSRVSCTGEWRPAGRRTYDVTMYCLWRQDPGLQPDVIRYRLTVNRKGNALQGPFKYRYMDPWLGQPGTEGEYFLKSVRLGLVPLD
jgi:hypothetical protein